MNWKRKTNRKLEVCLSACDPIRVMRSTTWGRQTKRGHFFQVPACAKSSQFQVENPLVNFWKLLPSGDLEVCEWNCDLSLGLPIFLSFRRWSSSVVKLLKRFKINGCNYPETKCSVSWTQLRSIYLHPIFANCKNPKMFFFEETTKLCALILLAVGSLFFSQISNLRRELL